MTDHTIRDRELIGHGAIKELSRMGGMKPDSTGRTNQIIAQQSPTGQPRIGALAKGKSPGVKRFGQLGSGTHLSSVNRKPTSEAVFPRRGYAQTSLSAAKRAR